jgi:hypothetical protein
MFENVFRLHCTQYKLVNVCWIYAILLKFTCPQEESRADSQQDQTVRARTTSTDSRDISNSRDIMTAGTRATAETPATASNINNRSIQQQERCKKEQNVSMQQQLCCHHLQRHMQQKVLQLQLLYCRL